MPPRASRTLANTHPFAMRGRIMAHNGGFGELGRLEEQLGSYRDLVQGDTDSERYFALITQQIDAHGGDVAAGIAAAARWIAERLPVSSLNAIVAVAGELWALRYPGQHALHILERPRAEQPPAAPAAGRAARRPAPACTPAARPPRCTHRNCTRFLRSSWHRRNSTASTAGACSRPANWSTCAPT